jgi:hypothetical protein
MGMTGNEIRSFLVKEINKPNKPEEIGEVPRGT